MTKPIEVSRAALLVAAVLAAACDEGDLSDASPVRDADASDLHDPACPVIVQDKHCDARKRPIVFVHGSRNAGDSFQHPAQLFASNGYCSQRIRAIDYDGITRDDSVDVYAAVEARLDAEIAALRDLTGGRRVDLVAHAQGAAYAARYVASHKDRVAHYVHLAGGQLSENPGGVPTLCLSSTGDRPVTCSTSRNITFDDPDLDHFAVCSSQASFLEMYAFLNDDEEPEYDSVQCGHPVVIEGRAITYADNQPLSSSSQIEVYELGAAPRERGAPLATLRVREDGAVGPWTVRRGVAYEFKLVSGDDRPARFAYFPPFARTDRLLRFTFESRHATSLATSQMANLHDGTAALWLRRRRGAFLHGRDQLTVDGFPALNERAAGSGATVIGLYVLDQDADAQSSGGSVLRETFVSGTDVYLQASEPAFIEVDLNGQRLEVPNWPSRTGGLSMVWLD